MQKTMNGSLGKDEFYRSRSSVANLQGCSFDSSSWPA